MGRRGRRAWRALASAFACSLGLGLGAFAPSAHARELDLVGSWYVLVHYKDENATNADQERWDDRVWVFERKARRLRWVEYPIVVFEDEGGRFERRHTGQYARILHYWEPNAAQRANIAAGLKVNSRGSKNKSLRGSDAKGWASGRRGSAASASVVTYEEVWTIDGMPDLPVFRRADFMGGGRTDTMEGLTEYATTKREGDDWLEGTFVRDGSRRGTFRMMRAGAVGGLDAHKSQSDIQQEAFRRSIATSPQIRAQAADDLKGALEQEGIFLGAAELESLAGETVQWTVDGVPPPEIQQRVTERLAEDYWGFLPAAAEPDASVRYRFPFDPTTPRRLLLGVGGEGDAAVTREGLAGRLEQLARHTDWARHAFKFELPQGSAVQAARAGEVARVVDVPRPPGGARPGNPNGVWILHEDGTAALYLHLSSGIPVRPGRTVAAGEVLGKSGKPGYAKLPMLHFSVIRVDAGGSPQSVDIRFDDGSAEGVVPSAGRSYPGSAAGS
jgi:murein DD-endopeptidase MepM/ murein hydrolase activator NlpD